MNKIKDLREEAGLTQRQLAQKLQTSNANICRWENETAEISAMTAVKLAHFFGVTVDELLGLDELQPAQVEQRGLDADELALIAAYRSMPPALRAQLSGYVSGLTERYRLQSSRKA